MKVWVQDFAQNDLDTEFPSAGDLIEVPITAGTSLKRLLPIPLKVTLRYRRVRPAAFKVGAIIVVDGNVRNRLQSARTEIEFHPVEVTDKTKRDVLSYFFMNVLSELDCLDRAQSQYDVFHGYARRIRKLHLKGNQPPLDLFRVAGTLPALLVSSDNLAHDLSAIGRLGLKFVDVDQYRDASLVRISP